MRPGPIPPVPKGSSRHLSRRVINALINVCNNVITAESRGGIKYVYTDGKLLLEVDVEAIEGGGGINFEGEWIDQAYSEGDFVIRSNVAAINDGTVAGTYEAIQNVPQGTPAPGLPGAASHWRLFAKGYWNKLLIWQAEDDITTLEGGSVSADLSLRIGRETGPRVLMTKDQIQNLNAPEANQLVYLQRIETCESGVPSYRIIPSSDPWPQ